MAKKHRPIEYKCPTHGVVDEVDVAFLCNTCKTTEVKKVGGLYVCPECFTSSYPMMCRICEDKNVTMYSPLKAQDA